MRALLFTAFVVALVAVDIATLSYRAAEMTEDGPASHALLCVKDACAAALAFLINKSSSIACAFYDLDHPVIIAALIDAIEKNKDVRLVLDDRNAKGTPSASTMARHVRIDTDDGQMHNKFCIFDEHVVWTGSMNPTVKGDGQNDNNVVVIASGRIASDFLDEFEELWSGIYRRGDRTRKRSVQQGDATIQALFCPEDQCAEKVIETLSRANETILFMAFSFTHRGIADALIDAHNRGVTVQGVVEKTGSSSSSMYNMLHDAGIDARHDANPAMMHHKVFIADGRTVITGSFNPTYNGDARNDENLLIIRDAELAKPFEEEFRRVFGMARRHETLR